MLTKSEFEQLKKKIIKDNENKYERTIEFTFLKVNSIGEYELPIEVCLALNRISEYVSENLIEEERLKESKYNMLTQKEFSILEKAINMMETFADRTRATQVLISRENILSLLQEFVEPQSREINKSKESN